MFKLIGRVLVLMVFGWAGSANAGLMMNVSSNQEPSICFACSEAGSTFGYTFDVTSAITVDGLGLWDFDADGIGQDVSVGLWVDGGALLASTVISNSSPLDFTNSKGGWRFEDIAALFLGPGSYVIGATIFPTTPEAYLSPSYSVIDEVTINQGRFNASDSDGLVRPDSDFVFNVVGPNLRVTQNAEIPAPATLLLLGLGLAALGFSCRERVTS